MSEEFNLTDDVNDEDSLYSLDEEDEETRDAIRAYIG